MQDPSEDTEWNDILRAKGILSPKTKETEITEDQLVCMLEETIEQKQNDSKHYVADVFVSWHRGGRALSGAPISVDVGSINAIVYDKRYANI